MRVESVSFDCGCAYNVEREARIVGSDIREVYRLETRAYGHHTPDEVIRGPHTLEEVKVALQQLAENLL